MLQKVTGLNQPPIMLMPKDPSSLKGQTSDFNQWSLHYVRGNRYDHIMIPLEGYYDYQPKNNI